MRVFRQGDVGVFEITEAQVDESKLKLVKRDTQNRVILAEGEVTGHAHAIVADEVELYDVMDEVDRILKISNKAGAALVHDEHATIDLPQGFYAIKVQQEYSPQEIRRVAD